VRAEIENEENPVAREGGVQRIHGHANTLLHELGSDDSDEAGVGLVGHSTGQQSLASAWRTIQQHSFGRIDTKSYKLLGLRKEKKGQFR